MGSQGQAFFWTEEGGAAILTPAMDANLHLHSRFSDGSSWPEDIALDAARRGLAMVALTDHDTLGGTERFAAACGCLGLQAIHACEIDVVEPEIDYKSEILAYFPRKADKGLPATKALLAEVLEGRRKRLEYYLYWSRTIFRREDLRFEDILKERLDGTEADEATIDSLSWSKVDIFLYLKARGLLSPKLGYKGFKKDWFVPGRFPKYRLSKPTVGACVEAIHADSGLAVIPHFGHLWNDDVAAMEGDAANLQARLRHFRAQGVDGIELYWYSGKKKTEEINTFVAAAAAPLGYFFTYGSDCHGPGTDKYTMDSFSGDFGGFSEIVTRY
jgi:3',5'-nucleoside bisphosphate phosphatase